MGWGRIPLQRSVKPDSDRAMRLLAMQLDRRVVLSEPPCNSIQGCISQPLSCVKFVVDWQITTDVFHNPCRALKFVRCCRRLAHDKLTRDKGCETGIVEFVIKFRVNDKPAVNA